MRKIYFLAITALSAFVSCSSEKEVKKEAPLTRVVLPQPFRFHKSVEVKPGLTFDILSWGRGSGEAGEYLILRSDSSRMEYDTVSEELEGKIVDVWNMDLDSDGNPEIFIQTQGLEKKQYFNLEVHEFSQSGSSQQIKFPELTSATMKKYQGKDFVYTKEGRLYREFPLYDEKDTAGVKPIDKKIVEYLIKGNRFDIKEIDEKKEQ